MRCNQDIRSKINKENIFYWQVAHHLNVSDVTFSKMLRKELKDREKEKVYKAITRVKQEG